MARKVEAELESELRLIPAEDEIHCQAGAGQRSPGDGPTARHLAYRSASGMCPLERGLHSAAACPWVTRPGAGV